MNEPGMRELRSAARPIMAAWAAVLAGLLQLAGCAAPDLKPFAEASKTVSTAVTSGGSLAIDPIARAPFWDGTKFVAPDDAIHPATALRDSWLLRRKTMDAVLVYSASLVAISDAAAKRGENATAVVKAVSDLAAAVPGVNVVSKGVGDLAIFGLKSIVEVKAFHDMRHAVASADPAVRLVAISLMEDFAQLGNLYAGAQGAARIRLTNDLRPVERIYAALLAQRATQRASVANNVADKTEGAELARIDALIAGVEPELNRLRAERAAVQVAQDGGRNLFVAAGKAVEAWANAHSDLALALEQNRAPNLVLLGARADELKLIVDDLRK